MKFIIFACLIAFAAAGIVPSAPYAAYSSPLAYSSLSPFTYSNFYNAPLGYNAPFARSSFGYSPAAAPFAYSSASPFYRNSYFRSYPYAF